MNGQEPRSRPMPRVHFGNQLTSFSRIVAKLSTLGWLLIPCAYCIGVTVFLFARPWLATQRESYLEDALKALGPTALSSVLLGASPSPSRLLLSMVFPYAWVTALLLRPVGLLAGQIEFDPNTSFLIAFLLRAAGLSAGSNVNRMALSLLSPAAAAVLCLMLATAVSWQLFRLLRPRPVQTSRAPIWAVLMPWVTLVPLFYFAGHAIQWLMVFVFANALAGLTLMGAIVFSHRSFAFDSEAKQQ
jgi:hypothetical protein